MHGPFRGFNRAQAAVVEAAILVSRLHMLPREKVERRDGLPAASPSTRRQAMPEREAWGWLTETVDRAFG